MTEDSRIKEHNRITMIVNGAQLSDCIIVSDESPHITKFDCSEMNAGVIKNITQITFNIGWSEMECFLRNNRVLIDSLCKSLLAFEVSFSEEDETAPQYYCEDGVLFRRAGSEACLVKYPIGRIDDVVDVSLGSTDANTSLIIGTSAFEGAIFVKTIRLPENVKAVYDRAFYNCISLEMLDSKPLLSIGKDAFENCYSLKQVDVAPYYSMIGINADNIREDEDGNFYDTYTKCIVELSEEIKETLSAYGYNFHGEEDVFDKNKNRYRLSYLGYCGKGIQCARFTSRNKDVIVIEGKGELIGDKLADVFKYADELYIGNHVTAIKKGHEAEDVYDSIFSGEYLKIVVGDAVREIDSYMFSEANIGELVIGKSLEIIREGAFFEAYIEDLFIPDSVNMIGEGIIDADPCRCKMISLPSTINCLDRWALTCRAGNPKVFLRGERPPKNICMWLLAGLDYHLVEGRVYIPSIWKQYLNDGYFENARQVIKECFHELEWDQWASEDMWIQALDCLQHHSRISEIVEVNNLIAKFANRTPANGMHISYLNKATELLDMYGELLSIMDEDRTPENEHRAVDLAAEIKQMVE